MCHPYPDADVLLQGKQCLAWLTCRQQLDNSDERPQGRLWLCKIKTDDSFFVTSCDRIIWWDMEGVIGETPPVPTAESELVGIKLVITANTKN